MSAPIPPAWAELLQGELEQPYFQDLMAFVDAERAAGPVYPPPDQVFTALRLTPPELALTPVRFQRPDGSSAFRPRHGTLYSSEALLDAEKRHGEVVEFGD